eukprot:TRINITY_DN22699_c0_g1_i1.p1 TRINITY_DN22699_c0_g1~~TRINITY_DN22699_c0_g1_i1.p1  ORF type:complete len:222 (-),score=42.69 TRINITY_DN22699_c0_g1_i1:75-740(-)
MAEEGHRFRPIETDPILFNKFIHEGGVSKSYSFYELYSLEDTSYIPSPAQAVVFLFPDKELEDCTPDVKDELPKDVYFMKQKDVGHACGFIAMLHSLANNDISYEKDSIIKSYLDTTKDANAFAKCVAFSKNQPIIKLAEECAVQGQSAVVGAEDPLGYHYVSFVHVNGILYQLTGAKSGPIPYGSSSESTFLQDVIKVIQTHYVEKKKTIDFSVLVLVKE